MILQNASKRETVPLLQTLRRGLKLVLGAEDAYRWFVIALLLRVMYLTDPSLITGYKHFQYRIEESGT